MIGIDSGHKGILAKILCETGVNIDVGEPLAIYVDDQGKISRKRKTIINMNCLIFSHVCLYRFIL